MVKKMVIEWDFYWDLRVKLMEFIGIDWILLVTIMEINGM
jgi:hypothetical protein